MTEKVVNNDQEGNLYDKLVQWFDERFGFTKTPLKPVPEYTLNPLYWLGILMAVAFVFQITTGMFQLIYYVPSPDQAYSSTQYIINNVPLGQIVETVHLYTAYAMILLAFMHLARNYFGSSYKKPRELMWVVGLGLLFLTLGFGVTGYLLPWTVLSKSATDVGLGILSFLPSQIVGFTKFLLVGSGSDSDELRHFVAIHTVILPWSLGALLVLKIYMFEVHGPSYVSAYGKARSKILGWFPRVFLYAVPLIFVFLATIIGLSAIFPINLPPVYNPQTAAQYTAQPEWYLLWLYQILKLGFFEGLNGVFALVLLGAFLIALALLPFFDKSIRRSPGSRPVFITVGAVILSEFLTLTIWGYLTPGQVAPIFEALGVLGSIAIVTVFLSWLLYHVRNSRIQTPEASSSHKPVKEPVLSNDRNLHSITGYGRYGRFTTLYTLTLSTSSVSLATVVNMLKSPIPNVVQIFLIALVFTISTVFMLAMTKKIVKKYEQEMVMK